MVSVNRYVQVFLGVGGFESSVVAAQVLGGGGEGGWRLPQLRIAGKISGRWKLQTIHRLQSCRRGVKAYSCLAPSAFVALDLL